MTDRAWRRIWPRFTSLLLVAITASGCSLRQNRLLKTEIQDLQSRIYELQKRNAEAQVEIQELRERAGPTGAAAARIAPIRRLGARRSRPHAACAGRTRPRVGRLTARRLLITISVLLTLLLIVAAFSLAIGSERIGLGTVADVIASELTGRISNASPEHLMIVANIRLPRVLMAITVGVALAVAGASSSARRAPSTARPRHRRSGRTLRSGPFRPMPPPSAPANSSPTPTVTCTGSARCACASSLCTARGNGPTWRSTSSRV